jgi:hypothetical protein
MATPPPIHELQFLSLTSNHAELSSKLRTLGTPVPTLLEYAEHVTTRWFQLAQDHLREGAASLKVGAARTTYSRSYYAAYNASKAVRYMVKGFVSLKGDDHKRASDLPEDFPYAAARGQEITSLYENRLRADYDNWSTTAGEFTCSPQEALRLASIVVDEARLYLNGKFGMTL